MADVIQRIGPVKLQPRRVPPFESLVHAIIHQQLSGDAASTILKRFQALYGVTVFPSPHAVAGTDIEKLRTAGLSRAKAAYIKGLAEKVIEGVVPSLDSCDCLTDDDLVQRLTMIKGIGRWTAQMLLIFNLGRQDVLPIEDLGVRRGYQIAYKKRSLPAPAHLHRVGLRWMPFRTTAALYLWRMADFLKNDAW
ncbi:MAG: DNA-3-methyladenine glycosylase family protein [Terriglobia bacterium]